MKNKYILKNREILMSILLLCSSLSCATWNESSPERLDKIHEEDKIRERWFDKYIKSVLYVGMSEDEFVSLFIKDNFWNDPQRPYIIKQNGSKYIVLGSNGIKHRVSFRDAKLDKFETLGYEKIPVIGARSWDYTDLLKGYKISEGLYKGMPEDEFLRNFSNQILSRFKNGYEILLKDGHKYGVEFTDGILTHSWRSN